MRHIHEKETSESLLLSYFGLPVHFHFDMTLRKLKASAELNHKHSSEGSRKKRFSTSQQAHEILPEINLYR